MIPLVGWPIASFCAILNAIWPDALNDKLGYRRLPGWLAWEKVL